MRYYPIFVDLSGKHCLVVGAGEVGRRKIETLLKCGAPALTVLDLVEPDDDLRRIFEQPGVVFERREFCESDLDGKFLVIASTGSEEINWRISRLCAERGLLCNVVDQPEKCSFIVPAMFTRGDLTLAVSTGGASPALAKKIRKSLDDYFGSEYGAFLVLMGRLRPMVLELGQSTDENSILFRSLVGSDLLEALGADDLPWAQDILARHLPEPLHSRISELLHGIA
jgi:precorrin-2 dehydrogenase/sirohydrochlorin ferrochelatase